ncbi:uncharacterized protein C8Q71DRAFT_822313 [Rhodofomes roseus]|uniref:Chromosome segregation ATPase n=1 Tax=Rhodofomes roseus TaxID=34475 RepID=A0ABQ8KIC3_9APHY|nr:uncharacterized protein C8Q71DRAFT_822313 [Rhodofomes roseus]KAH9837236.1 hypothetical protein C8Q71DRAFT_822313 [Rhodofomes roseus]
MSTWGIGDDHDSDEVQALKEQLRNKDAQYATLHSQLLKGEDERHDLRDSFDDVVTKLRREADRALQLDATITQRNQELQNERITRQNADAALAATQQKLKAAEQTSHELQGTLDSLSRGIQSTSSQKGALETENFTLKAKVRSLQAELAAKDHAAETSLRQSRNATTGQRGRPRSSSANNFRVTALERDSADLHSRLAQQSTQLREAKSQAARLQESLVQKENEMMAMQKQLRRELDEARSSLEDRQEELRMIQGSGGADAAAREASLLERLEDEERRAAMLEAELKRSSGTQNKRELAMLQGEVQRTLDLLEAEKRKVQGAEARLVELVADKESALDERDGACQQAQQMQGCIREMSIRIQDLENRLASSVQGSLVPLSPGRDAEAAATIERLLNKIESLRSERDGLRYERDDLQKDFDFLTDESRFTIEDLRTKLSAALTSTNASSHAHALVPRNASAGYHNARLGGHVLVFALVAQYSAEQDADNVARIEFLSHSLSIARGELAFAQQSLVDKETHISDMKADIDEKDAGLHQLQATLAETTHNLHLAESTIAACKDIISRLEEERSRDRDHQNDAGTTLTQAEAHLEELSKALLEAETQRDALALQLQHTQQDLETTRQELTEAEGRFAQQLRSLSSGQSDKALNDQISALEERVDRRTQQIGLHQHDIKRLETNLRLQEERVAEMTAELEVMMGEKEAMVEDCRASREDRDEARSQCEALEEKAEQLEDERGELRAALESVKADARSLTEQIQQLTQQRAMSGSVEAELQSRFNEERTCLSQALEEKTRLAEGLRYEASRLENEAIQATVALATVYAAVRATDVSKRCAEDARVLAQQESALLRRDVEDKEAQITSLQQQLDALRELQAAADGEKESQLLAEQTRLQEELQSLRSAHSEVRLTLERESQRFSQTSEESQQKLAESARTESRLREQLAAVEAAKAEAVQTLQVQLDKVTADLEAIQASHEQLKQSHLETETVLIASKRELEQQLQDALARLQETDRIGDELTAIRADQQKELDDLYDDFERTKAALDEANFSRKEIDVQCQDLIGEVEALKAQLSERTEAYEAAEAEFEQLRDCELKEMKVRLDSTAREAEQARSVLSDLDLRYQQLSEESSAVKNDLENQLTSAQDEVDYLKATLRGEMDLHSRTQKEHEEEVRLAKDKTAEAERESGQLRQEITALRTQLEEAETSLQTLENERTALQFEATSMSGEVQRLKSLQRYLESQVKDSETRIQSLSDDLDEVRSKLVQSEKAFQGLEATSSMREIQQEQTIHALKRDLHALRSNPSLQEKIADLEERNMDMEELLRNKCMEIEENDDRFIEVLKEKKKLTSKIESLTRKLHALQSKVAAGEAGTSTPKAGVQAGPSVPALRTARPSTSTVNLPVVPRLERVAQPQPPLPTPTYTPTTPNPRSRIASGPSALPRPKTPESRTSQPTVFRARTPEARRTPSHAPPMPPIPAMPMASSSMETTSTAGKKRRAPDDFDDCESLPPQGFTADCLPVNQPTTPRARRALQAVRTGFTPVRHQVAQLSPRRATTASLPPVIADVTNSPRGKASAQEATAAKRGWLGKIRNGSGQARAVSSRPMFDRR